jgi:phosphoribosylformimino-5-aminoimidazole carboxamide ribotide isomerase
MRLALDLGADRVVVGTAAVDNPDFLSEAVQQFGSAVVFSIDARDGLVATRGWKETTKLNAVDVARDAAKRGVHRLIFTDITQDGTLSGPNMELLKRIMDVSGLPVIVAGGVASVNHIEAARKAGAAGAVVGRAIYDGTLDLATAIKQLQAA